MEVAVGSPPLLSPSAAAAWEEIRSILADFLYETATRMEEDSRRRNTAAPSNESTPATQPREVSCPVCFANLPTIALRLCGHTLCRPCSNRVGDRCPTCRELVVGRFTIYLPRDGTLSSRRMSTSSLDRFLYWIMFNLGTIRSADVPKPHPGPHRLTASHNKVRLPCSRQFIMGAAILNTRETKKVRLGYPVPANFSRHRRHIGIPSVPRFSLTGPNKSPILPKNTDFDTPNHPTTLG
ncbi:hypothetical protein J6590_094193 [Homalodisca vitripennis]|nr:hypothetical protein J6590_094193 [Homalodisca vitripennis]